MLKSISEATGKTARENNEWNSTALKWRLFNLKIHFMNSINFSKGELSVCHKNNCLNVRGDIAKVIVFGLATLIVIRGIASMLEQSNS